MMFVVLPRFTDRFVAAGVVEPEILHIVPSRVDDRPDFVLDAGEASA